MSDTANLAAAPTPEATQGDELALLRAEIDRLDDALHDLLMRRVEVVARLAASRAKGNGPPLRPGREAVILRRLLARHRGPLPRAYLVRLWRELLGVHTALQAPLAVAAWLPEAGHEVLRAHLGLAAQVTRCTEAEAAIAAFDAGGADIVALPPAGRWWRALYPGRLAVTARLPFFGSSGATVFLLSPTPPDASGEDCTLIRVPAGRGEAGLAEAGLSPTVLTREEGLALVELPGTLVAGDVRLAALGATALGSYACPVTA